MSVIPLVRIIQSLIQANQVMDQYNVHNTISLDQQQFLYMYLRLYAVHTMPDYYECVGMCLRLVDSHKLFAQFFRFSKIYEWCFRPRFRTVQGTTWANEMKFVKNHAPGAGSITQPVDPQSSDLPLCPLNNNIY